MPERGFERTCALFANFYRGAVWGGNSIDTSHPAFLQDCRALHEMVTGRMSYNEFCTRHEDLANMPRMLEYLVQNGALPGAVLPEAVKVVVRVGATGLHLFAVHSFGEYDEDDRDGDFDYDAWEREQEDDLDFELPD